MSGWKKLAAASAGAAEGLNIEDIFSVWSHEADGTETDIPTGIDLSTEGGMVWGIRRNTANNPWIFDTERGANKFLYTNMNAAEQTNTSSGVKAFNTDGHTMHGTSTTFNSGGSNPTYMFHTWRKAPKYFDIQTWTGDGTEGRQISHNLGTTVGMIWVKRYDSAQEWRVFHRSLGASGSGNLSLHSTDAAASNGQHYWGNGTTATNPTSTHFTVGDHASVNANGATYVAYIFAHNNSDGGFGPNADQDVIACGSYTGTGSRQVINVGFRPQYIMIKRTDTTSDWTVFNDYSSLATFDENAPRFLYLNRNENESQSGTTQVYVSAHDEDPGFAVSYSLSSINASGGNYIYMAIRRSTMGDPPSVNQVYGHAFGSDLQDQNIGLYAPDMAMFSRQSGNTYDTIMPTRYIQMAPVSSKSAQGTAAFNKRGTFGNDGMGKVYAGVAGHTNWIQQVFKEWPGIFSTAYYTGNATQRTIPHDLGVQPELMLIKCISAAEDWCVYHKDIPKNGSYPGIVRLNENNGNDTFSSATSTTFVTDPTDSVFTVGTHDNINKNNHEFVAYLFATKEGFSKIGSYTGDGTNGRTLDFGFTSGARFFVTKKISTSGNWLSFNSNRSIVAGTDLVKYLNLDGFAEGTGEDWVDPDNSGIIINDDGGGDSTNINGQTYIYWAMA
jgi:hypothetical protein